MCAEGVQRRGWQGPAPRAMLREKAHGWDGPASQGHPSVSETVREDLRLDSYSAAEDGAAQEVCRINKAYLEKARELRASLYPGQVPVKGSFSQLCLLIWTAQFLRQAGW